jgi:hypothetical protein
MDGRLSQMVEVGLRNDDERLLKVRSIGRSSEKAEHRPGDEECPTKGHECQPIGWIDDEPELRKPLADGLTRSRELRRGFQRVIDP